MSFLAPVNPAPPDAAILALERPHRDLLTYYLLSALVFPPAFPFLAPYLYFRYHTMRYKFTDEGISMSWGILFRRQIIINYARIQDIHLKSNIVDRWLGLARILVQTASGKRLPHLADMRLASRPRPPEPASFVFMHVDEIHDSWRPYLGSLAAAPVA